jgi:hypothetical protein
VKLEHQIDDTATGFRHRLVRAGYSLEEDSSSGPWVGYTAPATYHTTKGVFVATTDTYKGTAEFPKPGVIYWVQEAPASI